MTSPPTRIRVECPECGTEYDDWTRGSVNLDLDPWADEAYLRECSTATCPACGFVVELGTLVVVGDTWTFPQVEEVGIRPPAIDLDYSPEARDWIKGRDDPQCSSTG